MSARRDEREIDAATVRAEHRESVHVPAHWAYLLGVLILGTLLMLVLIAFLAGGA